MKIQILGETWQVRVLSEKQFTKQFPDCKAITLLEDQKIYFREDWFYKKYIRHELTHAFSSYTCTEELDMTVNQREEFLADFVAIHGQTVIELANKVYKELS